MGNPAIVTSVAAFTGGAHAQLVYKMLRNLIGLGEVYDIKLADALRALNIPRIGNTTSDKLAQYPDIVRELIRYRHETEIPVHLHSLYVKGLTTNFGDANTQSLMQNLHKLNRLDFIKHRIKWADTKTVEVKGKVAITGKLSVKRTDFENELRSAGYEPTGSITKDTKFLITDDPNGNSSKNAKASQLGVEKITESDFRSRYLRKERAYAK